MANILSTEHQHNTPKPGVGLRFKVASIVAGSFAILFCVQFTVAQAILLRNFTRLEEDNALINAARLQNALSNELNRLNDAGSDYSTWDETYRFVEGNNAKYVETQLYDNVFASLKINTIAIVNKSSHLLVHKSKDFYQSSIIPTPLEFLSYAPLGVKDLNHESQGKIKGILSSPTGLMLVISRPILENEGKRKANGVLSMGRFIDSPMLQQLSAATQLPVKLYRYQDSSLPQELQHVIRTTLKDTSFANQVLGKNTIASYVRVNDVFGQPALVLEAKSDRKIYDQGLHSLNYYFWSTLLIGLFFCALVLVLLEHFVLSRLSRVSQAIQAIGHHGTFCERLDLQGHDELTQLSQTINRTLDQLQEVQQAYQTSEERYTLAVVGSKDGIWDWNILNNNFYFSERLQNILGYKTKKLKRLLLKCINDQESTYLPELKAAINAHLQGLTPYFTYEQQLTLKNGTVRWVLCRGAVVRDPAGVPYRMAGSLTDISKFKTMVQLLADQTEELARSNQELEQFAYVASHDLQEPLRKIEAFGDRLQQKYKKNLDQQGQDYLERIQNAAGRMRTLLQDLLAFSRVTSQSREFTALALSTIIQEVLGDLEVRIQETKAQITVDPMPIIEADALQMRQLFQNLIGNALKFQRPGVLPQIKIQCNGGKSLVQPPQATALCTIRVTDNGIGFDEKYLDRIFKIFQRLHGRNEYEGTGIGLAICSKIVERHSGQLTAQSAHGEGATFIITIPLTQPKIIEEPQE